MSRRSLTFGLGALSLLLAVPPAALAQDRPAGSKVDEIFARMSKADGEDLWNESMALEGLGRQVAPEIARRLDAASEPAKVAGAKALLGMGGDDHRAAAVRALKDVIRGGSARSLRVRSCDLLSFYGTRAEVSPLQRDLDAVTDPIVKIHLLKALRVKGRYARADRMLREYLASDDFGVQAEAALILASPEIGNVAAGKSILAKIKDEPTPRGRQARAYLELDDMLTKLEKYEGLEERDEILKLRDREIAALKGELTRVRTEQRAGGGEAATIPGGKLFDELFRRIRESYVDESKTKPEDLVDAAAAGLVDKLDPFSSYMNTKSLSDFNSSIQQRYGGIGAVVQMDRKTGFLTIQQPIYGNPAFEAGLRTLDQVLEVEGKSTKDKTVQELVEVLKGPEGTPVKVKVKTFLTGEVKDIEIVRRSITLSSVRYDLLPGDIGYVQLSQFGHLATDEVESALQDLEKRGMKGLILDLRGNPGGLLSAAVEISDKFLDDDQLVVYQEGRKGSIYGARQEDGGPSIQRRRREQPKHPDYPLVVLIDENAASASEIVAGALQAHGRAELVGVQTFGKGSVQRIFPLESMQGNAALRMTIAYYYLPDGRLIHRDREVETWRFRERIRYEIQRWKQEGMLNESQAKELLDQYGQEPGGVEPDYKVEPSEMSSAVQRAYGLIFDLQLVEKYVQKQWAANKERFQKLAQFDDFAVDAYPGFDELWTKVQESLDEATRGEVTKEDVRRLLRATIRRFAQDDLARTFTSDYQEDHQLQAAVLLTLEKSGQSTEALAKLGFIKERFPNGVEKTRKPEVAEKGDDGAEKSSGQKRDFK